MTLTDDIRAIAPELTDEQITQIVALARELEPMHLQCSVDGACWIFDANGRPTLVSMTAGDIAAAEAHRAAQIRWRK